MKSFRKARVTWVGDHAYLGDRKSPMTADVHVNGSAAAINVADERVDRLLGVTVTEVRDGKDTVTQIVGRSEYLKAMGMHPDDQIVTVKVKGGKCLTC